MQKVTICSFIIKTVSYKLFREKAVLHGMTYSTNLNESNREIIKTFCIKICMIQFLNDRMSSMKRF